MSSGLIALGISHKTAPLPLRERLALPEGRAAGVLRDLVAHPEIHEAVAISTCNRTEIYLVASDPVDAESAALAALSRQAGIPPTELLGSLYSPREMDAARHLFSVAAGLESMIVGEAEIQGQVKRAYELALVEGATGPITNRLFRDALATGKRARTETAISRARVSVSSVAVELARGTLGEPDRAVVAAVGDEDGLDAAGGQRPGGQLGRLAGADQQHVASGQIAEGAGRELDGCGGHADPALADPGLAPHPLAGRQSAAEEPVEDRSGGALDERQLVGTLDLPLDLGLAEDHRIEAGRDPIEMPCGLDAAVRVEALDQLGRADPGLSRERAEGDVLGLDRLRHDQVELGSVAGRDRRRLADLRVRAEVVEDPGGAALGQRQALAELERRGLVGDAEGEQIAHERTSSGSGSSARRCSASSAISSISREIRLSFAAMIPM